MVGPPGGPLHDPRTAHGTSGSWPARAAASDSGQAGRGAAWDPRAQGPFPADAAAGGQASGGNAPGTAAGQRSTTGHFSIARAAARQPAVPTPGVGEGDEYLNIYIKDKDVREVLALLAEQGGLNVLPTKSVSGTISLSLSSVTIDEALQAILKTTGFVARRDGKFIYVGTPQDFDTHAQALDRVGTRIYRPNYVRAADLETIIAPLLTPGVGVIKASAPASVGIAPDANGAGGDALASGEALLVQDFQSILDRVDAIVREIDRKPPQVAIEAMILSVELSDKHSLGVDWQFLRNQGTIRFALGSPAPSLDDVALNEGGLKFAFLDSNLGVFLKALEEIGDTNVIATPRLLVLNKQRAEILIGAQLGYVNTTVTETSATQSVEFLEIGTQLRIRPFISGDGAIRMEIHPELSTGNVRVEQGITLPDKEVTSVTTNILVQDGSTVIIGGLVREDLMTTARQVPLVGNLPWVGALFRSKEEKTVRNEILVLVTPRIVCEPQLGNEGHTAACEFHRRQAVYADKMSPIGKRYLARRHFHLAQEAWAVGDARTALDHIEVAIHIDPMNRAAIDLRADILAGRRIGSHTIPSASQVLPHEPTSVPDSVGSGPGPAPGSR
jgi:type IV pilus assembly protein PilQ